MAERLHQPQQHHARTFHKIGTILDERERSYLYAREGIDPSTGSAWEPVWGGKELATEALVAAWAANGRAVVNERKRPAKKRRRGKGKGKDNTSHVEPCSSIAAVSQSQRTRKNDKRRRERPGRISVDARSTSESGSNSISKTTSILADSDNEGEARFRPVAGPSNTGIRPIRALQSPSSSSDPLENQIVMASPVSAPAVVASVCRQEVRPTQIRSIHVPTTATHTIVTTTQHDSVESGESGVVVPDSQQHQSLDAASQIAEPDSAVSAPSSSFGLVASPNLAATNVASSPPADSRPSTQSEQIIIVSSQIDICSQQSSVVFEDNSSRADSGRRSPKRRRLSDHRGRPLGPVPVPRPSDFSLSNAVSYESSASQHDPIENADSERAASPVMLAPSPLIVPRAIRQQRAIVTVSQGAQISKPRLTLGPPSSQSAAFVLDDDIENQDHSQSQRSRSSQGSRRSTQSSSQSSHPRSACLAAGGRGFVRVHNSPTNSIRAGPIPPFSRHRVRTGSAGGRLVIPLEKLQALRAQRQDGPGGSDEPPYAGHGAGGVAVRAHAVVLPTAPQLDDGEIECLSVHERSSAEKAKDIAAAFVASLGSSGSAAADATESGSGPSQSHDSNGDDGRHHSAVSGGAGSNYGANQGPYGQSQSYSAPASTNGGSGNGSGISDGGSRSATSGFYSSAQSSGAPYNYAQYPIHDGRSVGSQAAYGHLGNSFKRDRSSDVDDGTGKKARTEQASIESGTMPPQQPSMVQTQAPRPILPSMSSTGSYSPRQPYPHFPNQPGYNQQNHQAPPSGGSAGAYVQAPSSYGSPHPPPQPQYGRQNPPAFVNVPATPQPANIMSAPISSPSLVRVLGYATSGILASPSGSHSTTPARSLSPNPPTAKPVGQAPVQAQMGASVQPRLEVTTSTQASTVPAVTSSAAQPAVDGTRNASPAPGGANQLDHLIELVMASPFIKSEDGTKQEIVQFLRDPKAYISPDGDKPFNRSPHWAFELRRIDGVEKFDLVILHSDVGAYQLKRVREEARSTVNIAQSMSHFVKNGATTSRAQTPATEQGPILPPQQAQQNQPAQPKQVPAPAPAPAPAAVQPAPTSAGPPSVTTLTREQLESEVAALRAKQADHIEELTALRPLYSEVVKLRSDNSALNRQIRSLQSSREAAQSDLNYMQSQYQTASTAAVARAREAEVAEAETAKLRGLLDIGLKQREAVARSEKRALKLKVDRLVNEVKLLRDNEKRVQESEVRTKAAQWDNWCKMQEERWRRMESGEGSESEGSDEDEDATAAAAAADDEAPKTTPPSASAVDDNSVSVAQEDSSLLNSQLKTEEGAGSNLA